MATVQMKKGAFEPAWLIIDADGKTLGRVATRVAMILMGKQKPTYTPHVDTGDYVVVLNAGKIRLTGQKLQKKVYYRHSGWVGGLKQNTAEEMMADKPEDVLKIAVRGMLPKNRLGRQMLGKLKVHRDGGPSHGYKAQKAKAINV